MTLLLPSKGACCRHSRFTALEQCGIYKREQYTAQRHWVMYAMLNLGRAANANINT